MRYDLCCLCSLQQKFSSDFEWTKRQILNTPFCDHLLQFRLNVSLLDRRYTDVLSRHTRTDKLYCIVSRDQYLVLYLMLPPIRLITSYLVLTTLTSLWFSLPKKDNCNFILGVLYKYIESLPSITTQFNKYIIILSFNLRWTESASE